MELNILARVAQARGNGAHGEERGVVAQAELDRAQANYDSLQARIVQQRQQIDVAESRLALWQQAGGSFTRTGIGTIVDMSSLEIEVDVNESYINRVQPGQPVEATLDAYIDWKIPARVIAIIPTADRQRATVKVRIAFDAARPTHPPGHGRQGSFPRRRRPADAGEGSRPAASASSYRPRRCAATSGRDVVFVVANGGAGRAPRRDIGNQNETTMVVIVSGLSPGERVVVEGPPSWPTATPSNRGTLMSEANGTIVKARA